MLAVLKPDHAFFKKDYTPKRAVDNILIDNSDGFLDGLPPGKYKKRIGSVFKEPEENRLKRQLDLYKKRQKQHEERLVELANEKDSDEEDISDDSDVAGPLESSSQVFQPTMQKKVRCETEEQKLESASIQEPLS